MKVIIWREPRTVGVYCNERQLTVHYPRLNIEEDHEHLHHKHEPIQRKHLQEDSQEQKTLSFDSRMLVRCHFHQVL